MLTCFFADECCAGPIVGRLENLSHGREGYCLAHRKIALAAEAIMAVDMDCPELVTFEEAA
jgi:hypothetical protein